VLLYLLDAGAAELAGASAGAAEDALSGDLAGWLSPPHAAMPIDDAMVAKSATSTMFFIIVFSSEV
jgi:hypothetical protein